MEGVPQGSVSTQIVFSFYIKALDFQIGLCLIY